MPHAPQDLSTAELSRYSRHILLDEIGLDGQRKLAGSRVLVIGAGGLGSPAALYLAAAGVGTLGIADLDAVEDHNLQRQLLHDQTSVGQSKVESAALRLATINPHINVVQHPDGITPANAIKVFASYDVVVDGTDNFRSRYLNNDAAFFARKPLVFGSVYKFEGQVSVFDTSAGGPCYRCMFPEPPMPGSVPGCGEAGVLGALCGVIGSLQALEALKLLLKLGEPLVGRLLTYDALAQSFQSIALKRRPSCALCGTSPTLQDLAPAATVASGTSPSDSPPSMPEDTAPAEITVNAARQLLDSSPHRVMLIDVREPWEIQICQVAGARLIPMREIPERLDDLPQDQHLLIMCHHGGRSLRVAQFLQSRGFKEVSNVTGGIAAWAEELDPKMARY